MLHSVSVEALHFTIVHGNDQLDMNFPLRPQKEFLKRCINFYMLECLQGASLSGSDSVSLRSADLEGPACQVYLLKVYIVVSASSCVLAWGRLRLLAYQWLAVENVTEASLAFGTLPSASVR